MLYLLHSHLNTHTRTGRKQLFLAEKYTNLYLTLANNHLGKEIDEKFRWEHLQSKWLFLIFIKHSRKETNCKVEGRLFSRSIEVCAVSAHQCSLVWPQYSAMAVVTILDSALQADPDWWIEQRDHLVNLPLCYSLAHGYTVALCEGCNTTNWKIQTTARRFSCLLQIQEGHKVKSLWCCSNM